MSAATAITALTEGAELRAGSLIVTIFGDMARAPGTGIPGPVLSALAGRIGVRPEAMRVALHRLRKDGWIASRRAGRVSVYLLTEAGRAETEAATARIFARRPQAPDSWHVLVAGPLDPPARLALDGTMAAAGCIALAPGVWLGPGPAPAGLAPGFFALDGAAPRLPDWLRETLMPPALAESYADFEARLATVAALLGRCPGTLSPLDRAAIRILLVHGWRRLVLRHADLPDGFFPDGWRGAQARARVHALLDRLGPADVAALAEDAPA